MLTPKKPSANKNSDWPIYRLFGLALASEFRFSNRLKPAIGTADLTFTCMPEAPLPDSWEQTVPIYTSPCHTDDGESAAHLYRLDSCDILRFTRTADFYIQSDHITCHPLSPACGYLIEIHLLGSVLALWLEQQGTPVLHASAVAVNGQAAAFLSNNRGGKSSLAATLMQSDYPLLTDDILPIKRQHGTLFAHPGYPTMRMWPDEAQHFLGDHKNLETVHPLYDKCRVPVGIDGFGTFCDVSQPLACIYIPERCDPKDWGTKIEIIPLSPRDAVMDLVRYSFVPRVVQAIGLQSQRLDFFAQAVEEIPMRRIAYPDGFEHLPRIRKAILKDLKTV